MTKKIPPPPLPPGDPDRAIECETHLEPAFDELAEEALAQGWSEDEVEAALVGLARNRILSRIERQRTAMQMRMAKRQQ